ncbi:MAG: hypothetical protein F6J97_13185 [Leptolyngbya sp. SIO4C1]|nr:hypothetical protein [Leptolyngbya sp. SIO4C1]
MFKKSLFKVGPTVCAIAPLLIPLWPQPGFAAEAETVAPPLPALAQPTPFEPVTIVGELTARDRRLPDGSYAQIQTFEGQAGQQVLINLLSNEFDAFVLLIGPNNTLVGQDDNSGGGTQARLRALLTAVGVYKVVVNTANPDEFGHYTLTITPDGSADSEVAQSEAALIAIKGPSLPTSL